MPMVRLRIYQKALNSAEGENRTFWRRKKAVCEMSRRLLKMQSCFLFLKGFFSAADEESRSDAADSKNQCISRRFVDHGSVKRQTVIFEGDSSCLGRRCISPSIESEADGLAAGDVLEIIDAGEIEDRHL